MMVSVLLGALPPVWWELPYDEFLKERRVRMGRLVREGYQKLCGETPASKPEKISVAELLAADGETEVLLTPAERYVNRLRATSVVEQARLAQHRLAAPTGQAATATSSNCTRLPLAERFARPVLRATSR